jgi:predicted ATP-grasp superfamily ATP-dependent carboligase
VTGAMAAVDTPVLAFGSGLTALGVLRSLHGSGISVYSVCPPTDLAAKSRWYRRVPGQYGACPEPSQLEQFLKELPIRHAVLVPCSDDWARAISNLPEELRKSFPASVAESKVIETMTDKWRFANFIECLDISRPRTVQVESMNHLESLPEEIFEGTFIKPIDSQEFARYHHVKAYRIRDKQHSLEIMRKVLNEGGSGFPIMLQEFIPGDASSYYLVDGFVDRRGETQALIARRRLSQYPPHFGNSARSQTIPLQAVASAVESLQKM